MPLAAMPSRETLQAAPTDFPHDEQSYGSDQQRPNQLDPSRLIVHSDRQSDDKSAHHQGHEPFSHPGPPSHHESAVPIRSDDTGHTPSL